MGDIKHLVPPEYKHAVDRFDASRDIDDLIEAAKIIAPVTVQDESLAHVWRRVKDEAKGDQALTRILNWVSQLSFVRHPVGEDTESDREDRDESEPSDTDVDPKYAVIQEAARELGKALARPSEEVKEFQDEAPDYGRFVGIDPFLKYSDASGFAVLHDSAKTVSEYIEALYPSFEKTETIKVHQRWLNRFVIEELLPWAIEYEEEKGGGRYAVGSLEKIKALLPSLGVLLSEGFVFDWPRTWGSRFSPEVVLEALIHVPQAMFDRLFGSLIRCEGDALRAEETSVDETVEQRIDAVTIELFEIASALPFSHKATSWAEVQDSPVLWEHVSPWQRLDTIPLMSWSLHSQFLWDSLLDAGDSVNVYRIAQDEPELTNGEAYDVDDLERAILRIHKKVSELNRCGAPYHFDFESGAHFGAAFESAFDWLDGGHEGAHLSYLLATDVGLGYGQGVEQVNGASDEVWAINEDACRSKSVRSRNFRAAIESAARDGFQELSLALTAFYLLTQVLLFKERPGFDWAWLSEHLNWALKVEQKDLVRRSIDEAADALAAILPEGEASIDLLGLRQFDGVGARDRKLDKEAIRAAFEDMRKDDRRLAMESIGGCIGKEVWIGLDGAFKHELIAAEAARLRAERHEELDGNPKKAAELLMQYFRFVEQPVIKAYDRSLGGITMDASVAKLLGVKGNVGRRLDVLEGRIRDARPYLESIREQLPTALKDAELLDWLQRFKRARNAAAHEGAVPVPEFESLYGEMTDGRMLERFIEGMPLLSRRGR